MSLRFIDSFDHYVTADLSEKYQHAQSIAVQAATGRRGTACLYFGGGSVWVALTLDSQARWTVGFALRYEGWSPPGSPGQVLDLAYGGTAQLRLRVSEEGFLIVAAVSATTGSDIVLGVSAQALHTFVWYYLELSVLCQPAGTAEVRVDGVPWLTLAGVNTQPTAGVVPNQLRLGATSIQGLYRARLDDLYVCDGQGSGTFTTFLGDCRVDALFPNADGTYTDWTPSAGAAHYTVVDEPAPNDDTDYVSETTGGGRDSYQLAPLPTMPNPEVLAVQACISARKEDVDEIRISPLLVSGAVTSVAATAHALTASYLYARDLWTADPNGGGVWTEASVNSLQVGMERLA